MKFPRQALRLATALTLGVLLLLACASPPGPAKPRLLVFLVVDGLPMRQVTGYRDQLAPDGFARFLDRGAWFADAHYAHAFTVTAAGHATLLTGAYPHRSGIIGNEWNDPATGAPVYNTGDTRAGYIGHATRPLDGTSPANLRVETLGDVLRRVDARSKVISVSGKDRGAILLAGHGGGAYMYMDDSGQFASTTYYMKAHPAWVTAFNAQRPADRYFQAEWKALLPEAAYARSVPDNQPWYGPRGGALPMRMGVAADAAPGPGFYGALRRSPFVDALSLDFARAAVAGEALGQDDAPDILAVSLSGHDYVNHAFSAESRLSHDHFLQLDRLLQAFFRDLDASVGRGNYVAVLSADHGFTPAPEFAQAQGLSAGRLSGSQLLGRVNAALEKRFGVPQLARALSASAVLIDRQRVAAQGLDAGAVHEAARAALLAEPAVAAAYTRRELDSGSRAGAPFFAAMGKSWNKDVSGDVQYVLKPYWIFGSSSSAATHGSPHDIDNHVPVLVWGPSWVRAGRVDTRVDPAGIAPALARLLGVPVPQAAEGEALPLAGP